MPQPCVLPAVDDLQPCHSSRLSHLGWDTRIWIPLLVRERLMSYARQLLDSYPRTSNLDAGMLAATVDAVNDCAQACTGCADDDLSEPDITELVKCIRLDLDCADVCGATVRVISRQTEYDANLTRSLLEACATACRSCGDECERHAEMHEHCRVCAEACRRGEQSCRQLLAAIG
jgi:Domain of Unknown Function (DUF326)